MKPTLRDMRSTGPATEPMNRKRSLIDYYKVVLDKISFADRATFRKELRKAFRRLMPEERRELKQWFRTACVCKVGTDGRLQLQPVERPGTR